MRLLLLLLLIGLPPLARSDIISADFITYQLGIPAKPLLQTTWAYYSSTMIRPYPEYTDESARDLAILDFQSYFFTQLHSNPSLDWMYAGFQDGSFQGYAYDNQRQQLLTYQAPPITPTNTGSDYSSFPTDQQTGRITSDTPLVTFKGYDPRPRPWYEPALNSTNPPTNTFAETHALAYSWTDPYKFIQPGMPLGLSLSAPLFASSSPTAAPIGVLAADFLLTGLSTYLGTRFNPTNANTTFAYILEQDSHDLIATSFAGDEGVDADGDRIKATQSDHEFIRLTTQYLVDYEFIPKEGAARTTSLSGDRVIYNHQLVDHRADFAILDDTIGYDLTTLFWEAGFGKNPPRWIVVIATESLSNPPYVTMQHTPDDWWFVVFCLTFTTFVSLVCFIFVIVFRNTNIIKLSQPTFLGLLPIGGFMMAGGIVMLLGPPTASQCRYRFFFFNVAFSFTFSCFLWKIHRAYIIAKAARHMKKISFTNSDVYKYIGGMTLCDVILQGAASAFQPNVPGFLFECDSYDADGLCVKQEEVFTCLYDGGKEMGIGAPIFVFSAFLKFAMVGFGCVLVYRTKSLDAHYAESTVLLLTIYTVMVTGLALLLSSLFAERTGQVRVWAAAICYNICFPFAMMFVPRAIRLAVLGDISIEELMAKTQKMTAGGKSKAMKRGNSGGVAKSGSARKSGSGPSRSDSDASNKEVFKSNPAIEMSRKATITSKNSADVGANTGPQRKKTIGSRLSKMSSELAGAGKRTSRSSSVFGLSAPAMSSDPHDFAELEFYSFSEEDAGVGDAADAEIENEMHYVKDTGIQRQRTETTTL